MEISSNNVSLWRYFINDEKRVSLQHLHPNTIKFVWLVVYPIIAERHSYGNVTIVDDGLQNGAYGL